MAAKYQAGSTTFRVAAQRTLEQTRKVLVKVAKREHGKVMSDPPIPARFRRFVDGRQGASEETVKGNGVIFYQYPRIEVVAQYALEMLIKYSPVLSGAYRNAHTIYAGDGEIVITNPLPYSRKIEIGHMKMRVPGSSQVYEQAVSATNRRYGNIAKALFTWRGIVGGAAVNPALAGQTVLQRTIVRGENGRFLSGTRTVRISGGAHNASEVRFPALLIREL
jgi:hypothetical protein